MHPAALPSVVWARLRGIPKIGEVNGTIADLRLVYPRLLPIAPVIYQVCLACLRLSSSLITVTKPLAEWLRTKAGRVPVHVVPNGANTDLFRPDASPGANRAHPYVVFVGAMSPWQGIDTLLAAVDRPEWPEQVRLVFVGDGMARPAVQRAAERNARVVYYGQLPHRSISGILAASLAGLSTQNGKRGDAARYGFSAMKVFETMACGTPVIVTDFPGQGEVVREAGAGIVIQPEDAAGVASAVSFLYANPGVAAKMGARGREAAERFHTWQHRADQTDRIILELIDAESGTRSSADPTTAHRNQA
jgi:glycosyltransferase involved in cell wall biosynthesis